MRKNSVNRFNEGLATDYSVLNTSDKLYIDALNVTLINHDGNEFIIQSAKGNKKLSSLTEGFTPIGAVELNGIAYIISHNESTNEGEIGSFPSPDPNSDNLTDDYRPFQNYLDEALPVTDENVEDLNNYTDFRTTLFNFSLTNPLDVQAQLSYDDTINIIFTDSKNEPRIINSRFVQKPASKYEIVDRLGVKDTNLYNKNVFNSTINLIQRTVTIPDLVFNGVFTGGRLQCGNYRYYFRYETQDGNLTDVIEESSIVSVFHGITVGDIRGGTDNTNKRVSFTINNLDTSYAAIRVYFTIATAEQGLTPVTQLYSIENRYVIKSTSLDVIHNGFEAVQQVALSELNLQASSFKTARTITQASGRLFVANTKEQDYNIDALKDYAQSITINHTQTSLQSLPEGREQLFITSLTQSSISGGNPALNNGEYNAGYANPKNIYHNLGYWQGEAYPFGIVFILNNGDNSPVFPVIGADNFEDNFDGNFGLDGYDLTRSYTNGWNDKQNNLGIYRLPRRKRTPSFETVNGFTKVQINGIKLNIPAIPNEVKDIAVGCFFVRGERIADALTEGYLVPTFKVGAGVNSSDNNSLTDDIYDGDWSDNNINLQKFIPAPYGIVEGEDTDDDGANHYSNVLNTDCLLTVNTNEKPFPIISKNRFALYSTDAICKPSDYSELADNTFTISTQAFVSTLMQSPHEVIGTPNYYIPTLLAATTTTPAGVTYQDRLAEAKYIIGNTNNISINRFSGQIGDPGGINGFTIPSSVNTFEVSTTGVSLKQIGVYKEFSDYIGLKFELDFPNGNITELIRPNPADYLGAGALSNIFTSADLELYVRINALNEFPISEGNYLARLVRLHSEGGPRSLNALQTLYPDTNNVAYFPISKRMTFDELESKLDVDNNITLFGGDCFISHTFRKVFTNVKQEDENALLTESQDNRASLKIGLVMELIHQSNNNGFIRNEEEFSEVETAIYGKLRTFAPYGIKASEDFTTIRNPEFRLPETDNYNQGYSDNLTEKIYTPLPQNVPFIANKQPTRIYFSESDVANTFENGYRNFLGLNFIDYTKQYGEIVKIINLNENLIVVFEHGIAAVGISDKAIVDSNIGSLQLSEVGVLNPRLQMISTEYGSTYQWSIIQSQNTIYGVDVEKGKIWRLEGGRLKLISDFKVEKVLKELANYYINQAVSINTLDVRAFYDPYKNDLIWTFYRKINGDFYARTITCDGGIIKNTTLTLTFNEDLNQWITFNSFIPSISFTNHNKFFTVPVDSNGIWKHNEPNYCHYYGTQYPLELEFIVLENSGVQKIYNNLKIISNNSIPIKVIYNNDNDSNVVQETTQRELGNILKADVQYKENHVYLIVQKNKKKRIRDKYTKIKLIYSGEDYTFISAVITSFNYSFN